LIAALTRRIRAFEQGNPRPVLDPQAVAEARDLLARAVDAGRAVPLDAARVVAWLHWYRYLALPEGQDLDDMHAAIELFAPMTEVDPQAVPDPVRQYLATYGNDAVPAGQAQAAGNLLQRALHHDDPAALDQAVTLLTAAVTATPDGHPDRAGRLADLSSALRMRFERTGAGADLDEAINVARQALAVTPDDHIHRSVMLAALGIALEMRFEHAGAEGDLDEAISVVRLALAAIPDDHIDRAAVLAALGLSLKMRFRRTGAGADLDEAISLIRQAMAAIPDDHPDRPGVLANLGNALSVRFERAGAAQDLDEAIGVARQAVAAAPDDHPNRAMALANLGGTLRVRFERAGAAQDLDEAISVGRQAVAAAPDDHPNRPMALANLGAALRARFRRAGAAQDLDEAISVGRQAVAATPDGHSNRAGALADLGAALRARFERAGAAQDLDEAISVGRQALAVTPDGHANRPTVLSNLGNALSDRFELAGATQDMEEAISVGRQAVAGTPDDHARRATALANLAATLQTRFERTGAAQDLDEAISVGRQAVAATPADDPGLASHLYNLSLALRTRFERTDAAQDLDEAVRGWTLASRSPVAPVTMRLTAAGSAARAVARWREPAAAIEAYTEAVNLLPLLAWRGISHRDQQHLLHTHAGSLGREAAACAIAAGRLDLAVELLEAGRGVYWSQLLGTRTDLTALAQVAPELAEQLQNCRTVLEQPTGDEHTTGLTPAQAAEARMRAAHRFDDLIDQVRALSPTDAFPHPDTFLQPPPLPPLLPGPDHDPIAVINISHWRCDALLLTHHGVTAVTLDLTEDQVIDEANRYLTALHEFDRSRRTSTDLIYLEMAITTTLEWLWDHIAAPILNQLGHTATPTGQWPRLWWCPTGALTILPVHAAGHHHTHDTVLDRVVSSYTPTVRALAHARTQQASPHPAKILVIALPETPGQNRLPGAATERDLLTSRFTRRTRTVLTGAAATRRNVLTHLGAHRWLHASCHGTQDLIDPTAGGLLPHDWNTAGLITVTDLTSPDHTGGEFAFLSACKTATGSITNVDEAINVATAMQHAGWRHVVGTVWSVWDSAAAAVTQHLYAQLLHDGRLDPRTTAHALHHAIRALRDTNRDHPSTWAPFIHAGP
jgi:CHAT domain-containing protein/tetratricopeptide (TPR) repeat protein